MAGECDIERYRAAGIDWWDYCGQTLINSYPTYMAKLPVLIDRINREQRNSKNYVLFLGATEAPTNQAPCLSLIQHQIEEESLLSRRINAAPTQVSDYHPISTTSISCRDR